MYKGRLSVWENSFEDFVGYMMSGGNANSDVADFDAESAYAVDNFYYRSGTEEGKEYFRQLNQRWENFVKNSKENENEEFENKNSGECIVAKNRHGETKTIPLHWQGEYMRFTGSAGAKYE